MALPRWIARGFGFLVLAFFLSFAVGEGDAPVLMLVLLGLAVVGYVAAWRWEGLGSGLLVLAGLLLGVYAYAVAGSNRVGAALVIGLPFLAVGGLFLTSWKAAR